MSEHDCAKCKQPVGCEAESYRIELPDFKGGHFVASRICGPCFDKMDDGEKNALIQRALDDHNIAEIRRAHGHIEPTLFAAKEPTP